ncbi:hypothetical protein [Streptomyces sp. A30]|uniref:hypothetical protein n=1 Tax=Streptomyces sp. A30 TaxID=2789273 RepID=UPI00397FD99E
MADYGQQRARLDLVQHLGEGRRSWAATLAAGPTVSAARSAPQGDPESPQTCGSC